MAPEGHRPGPRGLQPFADLIGAANVLVSEAALSELTARAKGEKNTAEEANA